MKYLEVINVPNYKSDNAYTALEQCTVAKLWPLNEEFKWLGEMKGNQNSIS